HRSRADGGLGKGRLPAGLGIREEARHLSEMGVAAETTLHPAGHGVAAGTLERRLGEEQIAFGIDGILEQAMRQDHVRPCDAGVSANDLADETPVVGNELEVELSGRTAGAARARAVLS